MFPWLRLLGVGLSLIGKSKVDLLATTRVRLRVWPNDLDYNLHVNNGRYLALAQISGAVYDFCSPRLVFGRVTLVGDAASTPRPHIGFGVSKAAAEAQALAEALSNHDDIDQALAVYNTARQPLSERIVSHARKLGMQLGVGIATDEDRKFAKLLQTPKGILDWIAVPNFLDANL